MNNINPQNKIMTPAQKLNEQPLQPSTGTKVDIREVGGFIEVVSTAPTGIPKTFFDSIKLYSNGGTYRTYFYINGVGWKYTALT